MELNTNIDNSNAVPKSESLAGNTESTPPQSDQPVNQPPAQDDDDRDILNDLNQNNPDNQNEPPEDQDDPNQDPENQEFNDDEDIQKDIAGEDQDPEDQDFLDVPQDFEDMPEEVQEIAAHLPSELQQEFKGFIDYADHMVGQTRQQNQQLRSQLAKHNATNQGFDVIRQNFPDYQNLSNEDIIQKAYDSAQYEADMKRDPFVPWLSRMVEQTWMEQQAMGRQINSEEVLVKIRQLFDPGYDPNNAENPPLSMQAMRLLAEAETAALNKQARDETRQQRFRMHETQRFQQTVSQFQRDPSYGPAYNRIRSTPGGPEMFRAEHKVVKQQYPKATPYQHLQHTTKRVLSLMGYSAQGVEEQLGRGAPRTKPQDKPKITRRRNSNQPRNKGNNNNPADYNDDAEILRDVKGRFVSKQ